MSRQEKQWAEAVVCWFETIGEGVEIMKPLIKKQQYFYAKRERDVQFQHAIWTSLLILHEQEQLN